MFDPLASSILERPEGFFSPPGRVGQDSKALLDLISFHLDTLNASLVHLYSYSMYKTYALRAP